MSYEIVKSIKIKDGKVFMRAASNNVWPRDFDEYESHILTGILQEQGQKVLDLAIFGYYESGCLQPGTPNKYTRALSILRHLPEYENFNWRICGPEYKKIEENRKTDAFKELLKKALVAKLPKQKFIIKKDYFGKPIYLHPQTRHRSKWTPEKEMAKVFHWLQDAVDLKACFTNSEDWQIEAI
jgi:hypothetical protein